jgi:hypothetical protein
MKRIASGILVRSLAFAATACGDDSGDDATGATESPTDTIVRPTTGVENDVATAAEGYFAAFVGGDAATTRTFLSARCSAALPDPDFTTFIQGVAQQYPDLAITAWREVKVDGDTAEVEYDTGNSAIDADGPKQWVPRQLISLGSISSPSC